MDVSPPSAGGDGRSLTTRASMSPALACAAQLDALKSQLDVSPVATALRQPRASAFEGEAALHDAVLAAAVALPHPDLALDATAALLATACSRSIVATAELGALQVALQAAERLQAQPHLPQSPAAAGRGEANADASAKALTHFIRRREARQLRQAFVLWAARSLRKCCTRSLLRRAADVRSYRTARAAFQRWLAAVRETRVYAVAICRAIALCSAVHASAPQTGQPHGAAARSSVRDNLYRRRRDRRVLPPLPLLPLLTGSNSVPDKDARLEELVAQLAAARAEALDMKTLRERSDADAAVALANVRAEALAACNRAAAAELRIEQLEAQLEQAYMRADELDAPIHGTQVARNEIFAEQGKLSTTQNAGLAGGDESGAASIADGAADRIIATGVITPPLLEALQTPDAIRAKAARRVELLRSRLLELPSATAAAVDIRLPAQPDDGGFVFNDADVQSEFSEPVSFGSRAIGGTLALGTIQEQLSRILAVLGNQDGTAAAGVAAKDTSQQLAVALSDAKRPTKRTAKAEVMPPIIIRVTEVTDEVKGLRSELALAQATLEAVAKGAVQASRTPELASAPVADPQALMSQFAKVREAAEAEARSAVAATVDQLNGKLMVAQHALKASQAEVDRLRSELTGCGATISSLESDRQAAVEEAAQVWEILHEAQATLAAHDASSEIDVKAREEMQQRLAASEAALLELERVSAAAATAQQLMLDEAAELQSRQRVLQEELTACQAQLFSAEEQGRASQCVNAALQSELQAARALAADMQGQLQQMERRFEQLACGSTDVQATLEAEVATARHALLAVGQMFSEANAAHHAALFELQAMDAQGQAMQGLLQSLDVAFATAHSAAEQHALAHHALNCELDQARSDSASLEHALSATEAEAARLRIELTDASSEAQNATESIHILQRRLEQANAFVAELEAAAAAAEAAHAAAVSAMASDRDAADSRTSAAHERIHDLEAMMEVITAERDAAAAATEKLHSLYTDVESQLAGARRRCSDLDAALETAGAELLISKTQASAALKSAADAAEASSALILERDAAEARVSALKRRALELHAALETAALDNDAGSSALEQLSNLVAVTEEQLAAALQRVSDLETALSAATTELIGVKASALHASKVADEAAAVHTEVVEALQVALQERDAATAQSAALAQRALELQTVIESLSAERDAGSAAVTELRGTLTACEEQLAAARVLTDQLQGELRSVAAERDAASTACEQLSALRAALEEQLAGVRSESASLAAALAAVTAELQTTSARASEVATEAAAAHAARQEVDTALQVALQERDAATAQSAALAQRALELQTVIESLSAERDAGSAAVTELRGTLTACEEQLAAADLHTRELEAAHLDEIQSLKAQAAAAQEQLGASAEEQQVAVEQRSAAEGRARMFEQQAADANAATAALRVERDAVAAHCAELDIARAQLEEQVRAMSAQYEAFMTAGAGKQTQANVAEYATASGAPLAEHRRALVQAAAAEQDTTAARCAELQATNEALQARLATVQLQWAESAAVQQALLLQQQNDSLVHAEALREGSNDAHAKLQLAEAALETSRQATLALDADLASALSRAAELEQELTASRGQLRAAAAQANIMEARLADAFSEATEVSADVQRLELELSQAQAEAENMVTVLQQLEAEKKLATEQLRGLHLQLEAQSADAASRARAAAQLEQELAALRSEVEAAARSSTAAEKRARLAEAALGEEVEEVDQIQALMLAVQTHARTLASSAMVAQRTAVLAALGASPWCKEGTLWVRPEGSAGKTADWARRFATLSRTGVLQLHDGVTASSAVLLRVEVGGCGGVSTAPVACYRTLTLTRSKTSAFCLRARDAAAVILVASGLSDAETTSWAALLSVFLPACNDYNLQNDASAAQVVRRIAYA